MLRIVEASGGILNIASSLSGVPFLGAAALIVQEIVKTCDDIKVHKVCLNIGLYLVGARFNQVPLFTEESQTTVQQMHRDSQYNQ